MPNALRRLLPYTYGRADENLARRTEVRFLARTIVRVESACSGPESRHLSNQIVHQYLSLGAQIGAQGDRQAPTPMPHHLHLSFLLSTTAPGGVKVVSENP